MERRVVVTGMGAVTPIGNNLDIFWNNLLAGTNGVGKITRFDTSDYSVSIAAEVKDFQPEPVIDKKEVRRMDLFTQFAVVAAEEALDHAGLSNGSVDKERVGVVVGSGIGGLITIEDQHRTLLAKGPRRISPLFIPMLIADIAAGHISMRHGFKGPNYAVTSACATGTHAIGSAYKAIRYDDADVIVAGGSEAVVVPLGVGGFAAMKALSTRNDDPAHASRPFDAKRDGFVVGEGAGIVVLEELEHARRRGAKIFCELAGIGFTADAHHLTAPAPEGRGAQTAMRLALKEGNLKPEEIGYINAHGTSTEYNDKTETTAIKQVFGDHASSIPVSSTKSMTGHLLGAAGGVEFIAIVMAIHTGQLPPTINYEFPDPECDLDYVPNKSRSADIKAAMSNTFGFGGHNACAAVKKYAE